MRANFVIVCVITICAFHTFTVVKCSKSIFKEFAAHGGSVIKDGSKVIYCPAGPPGPPGPPGVPGVPGRDGRDGKTLIQVDKGAQLGAKPAPCPPQPPCPPPTACHPTAVPRPNPTPTNVPLGTHENPAWSCQEIYASNPNTRSGPQWLKTPHREAYQVHCEMVNDNSADRGGWTLVARVDGHTNDFAGISPTWTNSDLINEDEGTDLTKTSSMKNYGWGNIISNQLMSCFSGPREHCATFTHNKEMTLANLFKTQFAVETSERYTFKSLMGKFGKTLDISELKTEWCGLNLGDLCSLAHPPSKYHGTHVCRIGCIGDSSDGSCDPQDYALGIGVAVCRRNHRDKRCSLKDTSTKNLYYRTLAHKRHESYSQTAYIYIK